MSTYIFSSFESSSRPPGKSWNLIDNRDLVKGIVWGVSAVDSEALWILNTHLHKGAWILGEVDMWNRRHSAPVQKHCGETSKHFGHLIDHEVDKWPL